MWLTRLLSVALLLMGTMGRADAATNTLIVTSLNGPGILSVYINGNTGNTCTFSAANGYTCSFSVNTGANSTLTFGLNPGYQITGGTGLCAGQTSPTPTIYIPTTGTPICGVGTATMPQTGWWYSNDGSGRGLSIATSGTSVTAANMYGVLFSYRDDGSPVWYVINATSGNNGIFTGTGSEFVGGPTLTSGAAGLARLSNVVANVSLNFSTASTGTLTWTPRDGSQAVTKPIYRYPLNLQSVQPPPTNAPTTGWYYNTSQGGLGYFIEMQGTTTYIGAYSYDSTGRATWSSVGGTAVQSSGGWQLSNAQMMQYNGGSPINSGTSPAPTGTALGQVTVSMSPSTNQINFWTGLQVALTPFTAYGSTAGNWLQILNGNSANISAPYIAFTKPNNLVAYASKSQNTYLLVQPFAPIALSDVLNGSFSISATGIAGRVYVSAQPMSFPGGAEPNPSNTSDPNYNFRWQMFEVGGDYDISYVDLYSIPMSLNQGPSLYGAASSAQLSSLRSSLGALNPSGVLSQGGNFLRILSPANAAAVGNYPSLSNYINATNFGGINISNTYNGVSTANIPTTAVCAAAAYTAQTYTSSSITYTNNTLTISGTTSNNNTAFTMVIGPQTSVQQTASLTPSALSTAIYMGLIDYQITSAICSGTTQTENNGANDVFSLVARDLLVGFSAGLVGSSSYGAQPSSVWQTANTVFTGLQPTSSQASPLFNYWGYTVYNTFANWVYGFQYNDFFNGPNSAQPSGLGNPLMVIQPAMPVQVTLLPE